MRFKTKFCWWPKRLARHTLDGGMEFIGWVWMQKANLVDNYNHGRIAILDSKGFIPRCSQCGQELKP